MGYPYIKLSSMVRKIAHTPTKIFLNMKTYPAYYRNGSICIKRESATTGKQVQIPEQCRINGIGFQFLTTADKASFDKMVKDMQEVSFEVYEKYLTILHEMSKRQPAPFREAHEYTPEFLGSTARRI